MRQKQKAYYGIDGPGVIQFCLVVAALGVILGCVVLYCFATAQPMVRWGLGGGLLVLSALFLVPALIIPYGSLRLKMRERDWLLDALSWRGEELVLDVGCGRGLLSIGAAKRLTTGRVVGIDIWRKVDQSGSHPDLTMANIQLEGVADKVELQTADARSIPYQDAHFNYVVSSWVIHNIKSAADRLQAIQEMLRVLKPKGVLALMDIERTKEYEEYIGGLAGYSLRVLGPRYTFGNATYLLLVELER